MDAVLLDTDVFSYLMKPKDPRAELYRHHVTGKTLAISFITVGELYYGAEKKKWSGKTLRNFQERLKAVVVVPYDGELCRTYGKSDRQQVCPPQASQKKVRSLVFGTK
jgi:predicted nucleic acid-binding protein